MANFGFNADWDFNFLEMLIEQRGDELVHELGVACPCRRNAQLNSLAFDINNRPAAQREFGCEQCGGLGWIYRDAKLLKGLITGVDGGASRQLNEHGYLTPGDCVFSPSLFVREISDFDRFTFTYPVPVGDGQILIRNGGHINDLSSIRTGLESNQDRLWYYAGCVLWCEDTNGTVYQQNVDFSVDEKIITWNSRKPADGVPYTVKYTAFLEWIAYSTPFIRFDNNRSLGQRVALRKIHVAYMNGFKFDTPAKRADQESEFTTKL
jgi:hypothetical protein